MNEVKKMYENANIKICKRKQGFTLKDCTDRDCKKCGYYDMPPFTAEKQIELIKWMVKTNHKYLLRNIIVEHFSESLAGILNIYWSSLTEEERKQVEGILE